MKNQVLTVLIISMLSTGIFGQKKVTSEKITNQELKQHTLYLASDALKGRFPGTDGDKQSAEYIKNQFKSAGCTLLSDKGIQTFEIVTDVVAGKNNSLQFGTNNAVFGTDFMPLSFSANAALNITPVFVGYGFDIKNQNLTWSDYDSIDVKGKWVIIVRGTPAIKSKQKFFDEFSKDRSKVILAQDKGAAGVIFVNSTNDASVYELPKIGGNSGEAKMQIPVIQVTKAFASKIIPTKVVSLENIEKNIAEKEHPWSFVIGANLNGQTEVNFVNSKTQNVVASITGKNPNAKYIIVGAHFDHIGMGGAGSGSRKPDTTAVHNGADDNASGTALLIEMAQWIAANKKSLDCNYIFVAFGAEEQGLLGSKYFVKNPPVELSKIKAMFNFDMVGRLDTSRNSINIGGTGTAAEFDTILNLAATNAVYKFENSAAGYGPSDHASFYGENIPVLYFSTGAHDDYHTPADDADRINYLGMENIGNIVYNILKAVDADKQTISFKEAGPKSQAGGRTSLKVKLGIMPAFGDTQNNGLRIDGVTPDGPAFHAGLLKGDVITKINDMPITNVYDYMERLGKLSLGEIALIEVLRNNVKKIIQVQL